MKQALIKELKIAIINKDLEKLKKLSTSPFSFKNVEEAREALSLIKQAISILQKEKEILSHQMKKIKKLQKFNNNKEDKNFSVFKS